jgi:hypothetical protein
VVQDASPVGLRLAELSAESVTLTTNQYRAGAVSYLNVIVVQARRGPDEIAAVQIRGRGMVGSALLVKARGGGWSAAELPSAKEVTDRLKPPESKPGAYASNGPGDSRDSTPCSSVARPARPTPASAGSHA